MFNPIIRLACASILGLTGLTACSSRVSNGSGGGNQAAETAVDGGADLDGGFDSGADGDALSSSEPTCSVTFSWYQKDAYANHPGRTTQLWPPHTTTEIDATCSDGSTPSLVKANHGSTPSDTAGDGGLPLLALVKTSDPVTAPLSKVQALIATYASCDCESTTTFLSLNAFGTDQLAQMAAPLAQYAEDNLTCGDTDVSTIVDWIKSGDIDSVLGVYETCQWNNGESWGEGFTQAAKAALGSTYDSYHVCNNDAELESTLWNRFSASQDTTACDSNVELCKGPAFVYDPTAP